MKTVTHRRTPHEAKPTDPLKGWAWEIEHNAVSVARPSGGILIDGKHVADTIQCCHCGSHWIPVRGSGIVRGWCHYCQGPICGARCATCVPAEKMIEALEIS